jgi:hypothetical protein
MSFKFLTGALIEPGALAVTKQLKPIKSVQLVLKAPG